MTIANGISGVTDSARIRVTRRLSIGEKHQDRGYPVKLDHFQFRRKPDGYTWEIDTEAHNQLGERPTRVAIELISDDPNRVFRSELAAFEAKRTLFCYGNGERASRLDPASGTRSEIPCPFGECEYFQAGNCKPHGTLVFAVPALGPGLWDYHTTSWNTIRNLSESIRTLRAMTGGILAGLPLELRVFADVVKRKGHDKLTRIYVCNLAFDVVAVRAAARELAALRRAAWSTGDDSPPAPRLADLEADDLSDFAGEFHPAGADPPAAVEYVVKDPPAGNGASLPEPEPEPEALIPDLDLPEPPPGFAF